uniref:Lipocalin/cytosolic fatty-acid binding domain-containing protein n=1 Tax=Gasterosteus aculeatus aculeatus TaxID=481459 RepID=A0AAQ4QUL9_GASAC
MGRVVCVASLLVLSSVWMVQTVPVLLEPFIPTKENFDLDQFMGRWNEVAVVSTCPHYMQRKRRNPIIVALELQHGASDGNFTMTWLKGVIIQCDHTSTDYRLTNTTGRFFHHVANVDSFVVHYKHDEYAVIRLLSIEQPSGNKTTTFKLYSDTLLTAPGLEMNCIHQCGTFLKHKDKCCRHE